MRTTARIKNLENLSLLFSDLDDNTKTALKGGQGATIDIEQVEIYGPNSNGNGSPGMVVLPKPPDFGSGGSPSGGGTGPGSPQTNEKTYDGGTIEEVVVIGITNNNAYDIMQSISNVFTALGAAATHAEVNRAIAGIKSIPGLSAAGVITGGAGIYFNIVEYRDNPNWQDGGQVILGGVALILTAIPATAPVGIGMGVALSAWELYEAYQKAQNNEGNQVPR
ncbi:hypothetical protein [Sphingobacterium corticibacter]|uniref:Uncharacterized protein n=1 Tax=Sphingobacterium corticibacter TaxID=2171749 RepID=A0A2T8HGT5_9SPHI|nr:hypothetical protein [Sphingobacterium corticibacter]PVH24641.1 hypothetical protein DC487_14035 [Sphingobacterium corticibacter]